MPTLPGLPGAEQLLAVLIGGAVGSVARFLVGHIFGNWFGATFPWATLVVNSTGSIWLGYIATMTILKPGTIDPNMRLLLTTGFAGGFTPYSSFAFETLALYQRGEFDLVPLNIVCNLILGFLGAWLGIVIT